MGRVTKMAGPSGLAAAGLLASLAMVVTFVAPGTAHSSAIFQLSGQGTIARGSQACVGPLAAGTSDLVIGNGFAEDSNGNDFAVDWELRRGDPSSTFFTQAAVAQSDHAARFNPGVPAGDPSEPGNFWVCVSSTSRTAATYEITLSAGGA
jgi:hypothetical protein